MIIRTIESCDYSSVAELVCDSTNAWYQSKGAPPIFPHGPSSTVLFCEVYEALDPGCCVLAEEGSTGRLMGSCFFHPRSTHISLGIMNVHADFFGRGVARKLLGYIVELAEEKGLPIRLVSSAMNLDSFSLYSKAGFQPFATFQDMILDVPVSGLELPKAVDPSQSSSVRDASSTDITAMVTLEREVAGVDREKDFRFFIENESGYWHTTVAERDGKLVGFLTSIAQPGSSMVGPGVFRDESAAIACLQQELNFRRGKTMVFLAPCNCQSLIQYAYQIGAKNCEIHLAQSLGPWKPVEGVVMPTFMPETG